MPACTAAATTPLSTAGCSGSCIPPPNWPHAPFPAPVPAPLQALKRTECQSAPKGTPYASMVSMSGSLGRTSSALP
jgi:hypothetical protein